MCILFHLRGGNVVSATGLAERFEEEGEGRVIMALGESSPEAIARELYAMLESYNNEADSPPQSN